MRNDFNEVGLVNELEDPQIFALRSKTLEWLANGQTGVSSETMAFTALGIKRERNSHPHDPADLNRCIKLVEKVPEIKTAFNNIAAISSCWKAVIENWDLLRELFISEVGFDWSNARSAPKTYNKMKELFEAAK